MKPLLPRSREHGDTTQHLLVTTLVTATVATMGAPASMADDDPSMYRFGWCQELSRYQSVLGTYHMVNPEAFNFTTTEHRAATRDMKVKRNQALNAIRQDRSALARQYATWFKLAHYYRATQGGTAHWQNAAMNENLHLHMYCGIIGKPTPFDWPCYRQNT